jgi:hypothetical protein
VFFYEEVSGSMYGDKERNRKMRFIGPTMGIFIFIAAVAELIAASLLFFPFIFLIPILLPIWMLFWYTKRKRKKDARGQKVTLVDKSSYTVIDEDDNEGPS